MTWLLALIPAIALLAAAGILIRRDRRTRHVGTLPTPNIDIHSVLNGTGEQVDRTVYPASRPPRGERP